ncbi:MAG: hypothetical protein AAF609_07805 [Cyanobacteria bacterium P01_C01_bin.120]
MFFEQVRLRATQNSPLAFDSTYAQKNQLGDDDWRRRASQALDAELSAERQPPRAAERYFTLHLAADLTHQ